MPKVQRGKETARLRSLASEPLLADAFDEGGPVLRSAFGHASYSPFHSIYSPRQSPI